MERFIAWIILLLALLAPTTFGGSARAAEPAAQVCEAAAAAAERRNGLPAGLLAAIARVESGGAGSAGWPWTISAQGRGRTFPTAAQAQDEVRGLMAQGIRSIDVGCMQINLKHHPDAFGSVLEAFLPDANADYAARFLKSLFAAAGDWREAIGRYHSSTPDLKEAYAARVLAEWRAAPPAPTLAVVPAPVVQQALADPNGWRATQIAQYLARRAARSTLD